MCPPDERPVREVEGEAAPSIDELLHAGDVGALLDLAKSYRASRELKSTLACYEAAASLGSAEAEHAVGLFYLSGGIVPKDERKAAALFRSAADKGHLPARVYVANLYELGIHYKKDSEKADVWYRSVARAAKIIHDPSSLEYALEMAELGCVRQCLAVLEHSETTEEERAYFARKARAYGFREKNAPPEPLEGLHPHAPPQAERPPLAQEPPAGKREQARPASKEAFDPRKTVRIPRTSGAAVGLRAFVWAAFLVGAASGAGVLALELARFVVAKHGPFLGGHEARVALAAAGTLGVLSTLLVYSFRSVVQALLGAALSAGIGWISWRAPQAQLFHLQAGQAIAFGIAGYLASLLVLGLMGGAKRRPS